MQFKSLIAPLFASLLLLSCASDPKIENPPPAAQFNVFVITSMAKDHQKMIAAAMPLLHHMADENHFHVDITNDADAITAENLARYQVFVQLQEAPFDLSPAQQAVIQKFVEHGHGWVGIHAAGLPSRAYTNPSTPYWDWYELLIGGPNGLQYSPHPAYQPATLVIEDRNHPVTRHLPAEMHISDEWYEFNHSPRNSPGIHVLAHVDESTYHQNKPMGDHPMIWTNETFHRAIYICIGHDPSLLANPDYQTLLRDSILWAAEPQ